MSADTKLPRYFQDFLEPAGGNPYLAAALLYAQEEGLPIFPYDADAGKPLIKGWQSAATRDSEQLRKWWAEWPSRLLNLVSGWKRISG